MFRRSLRPVDPGTHDHVHRTCHVPTQDLVVGRRVTSPRVIPTADEVDRDVLIAIWEIDEVVLFPILVVGAVPHPADQPLLVFGGELQRCHPWAEWEQIQVVMSLPSHDGECFRSSWIAGSTASAPGVEHDPIPKPELERASIAHAGIAQVAHRIDRDDRRQMRRSRHRQGMLCPADIGSPDHTDLPVGPGLARDPGGAVDTVWPVVGQHVPNAFRAISAPSILSDEHVSPCRIVGSQLRVAVLVVRRPRQDDWKTTIDGHAIELRSIEIGGQMRSVPHRHHHIRFDMNLEFRLSRHQRRRNHRE